LEFRLPTSAGRFIALFNTSHLLIAFSDASEAAGTLESHRDEFIETTLPAVCAEADLALFLLKTLGNFTPGFGAFFVAASWLVVNVAAKADLDVIIKEDLDMDVEALPSGLLGEESEDLKLFSSSRLSERAVQAVPLETDRPLMTNVVLWCSGEYNSSTELSKSSRLKESGLGWKLCNELRDGSDFRVRRSEGGLGTNEEAVPLGG